MWDNVLTLRRVQDGVNTGALMCKGRVVIVEAVRDGDPNENLFDEFAAHWLPFFRRGCWPSGCATEASGHEKAE